MEANRELTALISEGESQFLEFKQSPPKDFAKSLVGMSNASGGRILIGVADDGRVVGWDHSNRNIAKLEDIASSCDPPVEITAERLENCLLIQVAESDSKPVVCRWGYYRRKGTRTARMSEKEINAETLKRNPPEFDRRICADFQYPDDFSEKAYGKWSETVSARVRNTPETLLPKLDAAENRDERLLLRNAAVLMFATRPEKFFPQAHITYLLFNGTEGTKIVKRSEIGGPAKAAIEEVLEILERHMNNAYVIGPKLRRDEIPEYPLEAVREAVTNAVVHRDWSVRGANVFVELHADRLCVKSPGEFPAGVTLENIERMCVRRNELLADLMQRAGYIEKAGTGVARMRQECEKHNIPPPEITSDGQVEVLFRPHPEAVRKK